MRQSPVHDPMTFLRSIEMSPFSGSHDNPFIYDGSAFLLGAINFVLLLLALSLQLHSHSEQQLTLHCVYAIPSTHLFLPPLKKSTSIYLQKNCNQIWQFLNRSHYYKRAPHAMKSSWRKMCVHCGYKETEHLSSNGHATKYMDSLNGYQAHPYAENQMSKLEGCPH